MFCLGPTKISWLTQVATLPHTSARHFLVQCQRASPFLFMLFFFPTHVHRRGSLCPTVWRKTKRVADRVKLSAGHCVASCAWHRDQQTALTPFSSPFPSPQARPTVAPSLRGRLGEVLPPEECSPAAAAATLGWGFIRTGMAAQDFGLRLVGEGGGRTGPLLRHYMPSIQHITVPLKRTQTLLTSFLNSDSNGWMSEE